MEFKSLLSCSYIKQLSEVNNTLFCFRKPSSWLSVGCLAHNETPESNTLRIQSIIIYLWLQRGWLSEYIRSDTVEGFLRLHFIRILYAQPSSHGVVTTTPRFENKEFSLFHYTILYYIKLHDTAVFSKRNSVSYSDLFKILKY